MIISATDWYSASTRAGHLGNVWARSDQAQLALALARPLTCWVMPRPLQPDEQTLQIHPPPFQPYSMFRYASMPGAFDNHAYVFSVDYSPTALLSSAVSSAVSAVHPTSISARMSEHKVEPQCYGSATRTDIICSESGLRFVYIRAAAP